MKKLGYFLAVLCCLTLWIPVMSHIGLLPFGNQNAIIESDGTEANSLTVYIDNKKIPAESHPMILLGEAFIPVRVLADALHMSVTWVGDTQEITLEDANLEIKMSINDFVGYINGQSVTLSSAPMMMDGTAYASLNAISDAVGYSLKYEQDAHELFVTTKGTLKQYTKKAVKAVQTAASSSTTPTDEAEAVAEIIAKADTLEKEIVINIGTLSEYKITNELLKSGKFNGLNWTSSSGIKGVTLRITPTYKMGHEVKFALGGGDASKLSEKAKTVYDGVRKIAGQIITEGMSDYDKVKAVHDYLIRTGKYDVEAAETVGTQDAAALHDSFTSYGLLSGGKGVCQAYSEAFDIFMMLLGIEANELVGKAEGISHSWNRVKLGGQWYHVDVTWDDPQPDKAEEISYAYFGLTDIEMAKDHSWTPDDIACTATEYNYFVKNNLIVRNQEDFERVMNNAYESGQAYGEMRLEGIEQGDLSFDFLGRLTKKTSLTISKSSRSDAIKVYF